MENEQSSLFDFSIDNMAANELNAIGKWAKRVSLIFGVLIAIVVLFIAFAGIVAKYLLQEFLPENISELIDNRSMGIVLPVIALVIGLLLMLYINLLYKFGNNLIKATTYQDQNALEEGFNSFKTYLIVTGIFSIIGAISNLFTFLN
jgi:predicted histidine transporter YuiF (NhaC family)